ncbi:hypothetical protein G6F38_013123 [Rhizopus arrhizus]|nr:hypothetical protein G6F38_013123 [Rhizopus arrhizus]
MVEDVKKSTHGSYPFQRVAIDFWGPLPTVQGVKAYKYILVVLDTYTKFVELFPMVSTSSEEVAEVFYNKFILKHGVSEEVLQDNDPPFSSPYHSQLTKLIGSENMFTPAYYPQSNVMNGIEVSDLYNLYTTILHIQQHTLHHSTWYMEDTQELLWSQQTKARFIITTSLHLKNLP